MNEIVPASLDFEAAPTPGMFYSERVKQLPTFRFLALRNMAYLIYRRVGGEPIMRWKDTLNNREKVFDVILQFELITGLVRPDYENTEYEELRGQLEELTKRVEALKPPEKELPSKPTHGRKG